MLVNMSEDLNNEKDATTNTNQTNQTDTETLLNKILANLADARFTDDGSSNMMYRILIQGNLNLNTFIMCCEKVNKEVPQMRIRTEHSCNIKTLYDSLSYASNHTFEELKHTYFDLPDGLDTSSECTLRVFYHYFFDDGDYVFSCRSAIWYHYGDDNIKKESTSKNHST